VKKLVLFGAVLALAIAATAGPVIAQEAKIEGGPSAKGGEKAEAKAAPGVEAKPGEAKAGGAEAKACPPAGGEAVAKAGGAEAKAPCPPPKAEEKGKEMPKEAPKEMPKTGGVAGTASLLGLGAGALLVAGGLLIRRVIRAS
jgi:LPXTG-motif cell wall-anchored protein